MKRQAFTTAEVAELLKAVEPRSALTPRQFGRLVSDGCFIPEMRQPLKQGDTRLYSLTDVALLRVFLRLIRGVGARWIAKACLLSKESELRDAIASGSDLMLVLEGARPSLVTRSKVPMTATCTVALADVRSGLVTAARQIRRTHPEIWTGWKHVDAREVVEALM